MKEIETVLSSGNQDEVETAQAQEQASIQLARERPSHLIAPAIHKSRQSVTDLFAAHHADMGLRNEFLQVAFDLLEVLGWDADARAAALKGTAMKRATLGMWHSNAAIAAGNGGTVPDDAAGSGSPG